MNFGLYDNIWGLSLVYLSMGLAISTFILRPTFMAIPKSLNEAAVLEGANFFTVFWKINIPLAKGVLTTAGILQFFTEAFSYDYTKLFVALSVVILPGIIIYILAQEQIQSSTISSGIKG